MIVVTYGKKPMAVRQESYALEEGEETPKQKKRKTRFTTFLVLAAVGGALVYAVSSTSGGSSRLPRRSYDAPPKKSDELSPEEIREIQERDREYFSRPEVIADNERFRKEYARAMRVQRMDKLDRDLIDQRRGRLCQAMGKA